MIEEIINIIIIVLIIIGAFFHLVAAIGAFRLPDIYTRNHAISKATTLGVSCLLLATFLFAYVELEHFNFRLILAIIFFFLTSPISGHLINRAAYNSGVSLWENSVRNDLKKGEKQVQK